MIKKYYTATGEEIFAEKRADGHYTISIHYPLKNEQTQGAERAAYVEKKVLSGEWMSEKTPEFVEAEAVMSGAFKTYQKGRAIGAIEGDTTFIPTETEGKIMVVEMKKDVDAPGIVGDVRSKMAALGVVGIAVIVAIGYLLISGGKKR